jgi:hypothetical protein
MIMTFLGPKRNFVVASLALMAALFVIQPAAWAAKRDLHVYFIDVEGGQSTLFVTPTAKLIMFC